MRLDVSEPNATLDTVISMFPNFKEYWEGEGDIYRYDDGSFTFCALFAVLSHYVREQYGYMKREQKEQLFRFVESCIPQKEDPNGIGEAVHTCFVENIIGDVPSDELRTYAKPKTRKILKYYDV